MRIFIAINIPDDIKNILRQTRDKIRDDVTRNINGRVVWVDPKIYHLTVKFCGDVALNNFQSIRNVISEAVQNFNSFSVKLVNCNLWPIKNPRIINVNLQPSELLDNLVRKVSQLVDGSQLIKPEFFGSKSTHLTIARLKGDWQGNFNNININKEFKVNSVDIMQSELTAQGPSYTLLDSIKLK